jgi:hypothetical protein
MTSYLNKLKQLYTEMKNASGSASTMTDNELALATIQGLRHSKDYQSLCEMVSFNDIEKLTTKVLFNQLLMKEQSIKGLKALDGAKTRDRERGLFTKSSRFNKRQWDCRFFLKGDCKKGDKCDYKHDKSKHEKSVFYMEEPDLFL